jgi:hypothetical protein
MIFPDQPVEQALKPENVWKRLDRPEGATPEEFELIRVVSYKFTSQIAPRWRVGRAFLAGDAAHLMPPFLAQGMCSGFRDAHNLAWKLDLVLKGLSPPELLDSYATERAPNARATIIESARVGQNVIERDHAKARDRDARLIAMQAELDKADGAKPLIAFRVPGLTQGVIARNGAAEGAGDAFPQARVRLNGRDGLFDDVAGRGFMIVARNGDPVAALSRDDRTFWTSLGGRTVLLDVIDDLEGVYRGLMDAYDCDIIVKRPDFSIFGTCRSAAQLPVLMTDLRRQLAHA